MLVGLFLAFETRKVKIKSLNESRFIAMSVYAAVIVSVTLAPIGFWLRNFSNVQYGIIGIMIMLSTSLILGLIFVTKVSDLYQFFVLFLSFSYMYVVVQSIQGSRGQRDRLH